MARSTPQIHLIQAHVLLFLVSDVLPDRRFISAHCGDEKASGPEVLTDKTPFPLAVHPGQMDHALSLDVSNHCDTAYFGFV